MDSVKLMTFDKEIISILLSNSESCCIFVSDTESNNLLIINLYHDRKETN
jgi:hypothetical protein